MKELHTFGWYAARISPELPPEAFKPVPARLWGGLAYLVVSIAGILVISLLELPFWLNLGIGAVLGACYAAMGFLGHEILHGTVVRKPWLRNVLGAIFFWPLCTGPRLWRKWHNVNHHGHTQNEQRDPDSWISMEQLSEQPVARWVYRLPFPVRALISFMSLSVTFTVHSCKMFVQYLRDFQPRKQPVVWLQFILPWVTWLGLLFWIGFVNWLFVFLLPLLIANFIVMCYISTNHRLNPLVPVNDPLANSLSVTVPKWVDVLHFNFSYHTEHHLFPGVSSKYYPLVKEHVKQKWPDLYHEMPLKTALKTLWKTPRIYYRDTELMDPRKGNVYGSLGNGLDPANIRYRKAAVNEDQP